VAKKIITKDDLRARKEIEILIPKEKLAYQEEKIAKEIQRKVTIKGFRPGRAPLALVKRLYGEEIKEEAKEEAIREGIIGFLREKESEIVSTIEILEKNEIEEGAIKVKVLLEVIPNFDFPDFHTIKVERKVRRVGESDVDEEIQRLRREMGEFVPVEKEIEEGDLVIAVLSVIGAQGEVETRKEVMFQVKWNQIDPALFNSLRGKKRGDKVKLERDLKLRGGRKLSKKYVYEIKSVGREKLPPLDDEFAKSLGFKNLGDMRKKIKEKLIERRREEAEEEFEWNLIREIYNRINFELPPSLVRQEIEILKENMDSSLLTSSADYEAQLKGIAEDFVKRHIILERFAEKNGVNVEEEEINKEIEKIAGEYNISPEKYKEELKKRNKLDSLVASLRRKKAMEMLKSLVKMEVIFE